MTAQTTTSEMPRLMSHQVLVDCLGLLPSQTMLTNPIAVMAANEKDKV